MSSKNDLRIREALESLRENIELLKNNVVTPAATIKIVERLVNVIDSNVTQMEIELDWCQRNIRKILFKMDDKE